MYSVGGMNGEDDINWGLIETSASRNKPQATNSVSKMFDIQF